MKDNKPKKIFIHANNVCERRKLDIRRIASYFTKNGYQIITNPRKTDIIILSTCGANDILTNYHLDNIKRFKKYHADLIVTGCIPDTDKGKFEKIYDGKFITTKNLEKIDTYFPDTKIKFNEIEDCNQPWITIDESKIHNVFKKLFMISVISKKLYVGFLDYLLKKFINEGHLLLDNLLDLPFDDFYTIRISEGCLGDCSYCSIKRALGRFQSKPFDQCITEFKKGLDAGFSNFFITAEDTGAYGKDIGKTFVDLLDELTKIKGNYNIGILEINPVWLIQQIDSFEGILKRGKIKAINVPVQSGSNRILKLMYRYSNSEKIQDVLLRLKKAHPDLILGTHVIVGFPTETEEEFKETLQLVKKTKINIGALIPISIKQDTVAENIEPKITQNEISRRLKYGKKYLNQLGYKTFSKKMIIFGKKW